MSRRELAIAIILFMGLLAPLVEVDGALFPQDQTISIVDTHDDKWTTETGPSIDSWLVHVTDPGYDIYSCVIFRGVEINFWEPLHNATLRLYTGNTLEFDKDSSITIYGMKVDELQNSLPVGPSFIRSVPQTDHYILLNTSQFYGPSNWWDLDVTDIVEELIRAHNWDGDGITGGETGDAIGFIMYGASGHDVRYFVDYRSDPALSAQLVIHWNHQPPLNDPPSDDPEFIEQHGNYTIWQELANMGYPLEPIEYIFTGDLAGPYEARYDNITGGGPYFIAYTNDTFQGISHNSQRKLVRMSDGRLFAIYSRYKSATDTFNMLVSASADEGITWVNETNLQNFESALDTYGKQSMAVDGFNNLHAVWEGEHSVIHETLRQLWYSKFNGTSWSTPLKLSTKAGMDSSAHPAPAISVDSNNFLHVVWYGKATGDTNPQIYYTTYNTSWSTPLRISTLGTMDEHTQNLPTITVDSNDYIHVAWYGEINTYPDDQQIWYSKYTDSWSTPLLISTYLGMTSADQANPCIAVNSLDIVEIVWFGLATGFTLENQVWYANATIPHEGGDWITPIRLSTKAGMESMHNRYPSIAVDSLEYLHVTFTSEDSKIYYANHTTSWATPITLQTGVTSSGQTSLRWSRWPIPENGSYFNADLNGTVVQGPFDTLQEAQDCIDRKDTDPKDPDPPGWVDAPVAFSRFRMRLYFLVIGYFAIWGPMWFFCWKRPSGFYICCGLLVMLMGLGLLLQIPYV